MTAAVLDLDEVISPLQRKTLRDAGMIIVNETVLLEKIPALNLVPDNLLTVVETMLSSPTVMIGDVVCAAAHATRFSHADLVGPNRINELAHLRQCAMAIARELTDCSLAQIGAYLGKRDHTTVLYGVQKIEQLVKAADPVTLDIINRIRRRVPAEIHTRVVQRHG